LLQLQAHELLLLLAVQQLATQLTDLRLHLSSHPDGWSKHIITGKEEQRQRV
jgi:hypothetical protein